MSKKLIEINQVTGSVPLEVIANYFKIANAIAISDENLLDLEAISFALVQMFEDDSMIRSHFILENENWKRLIEYRNLKGGL